MNEKDLYRYEKQLSEQGFRFIAGCDEAGRGPMAGPLVAAAVILPPDYRLPGLDDSKKLSPKKREELYRIIVRDAVQAEYEVITAADVDRLNPLEASRSAMTGAVLKLRKADYILTDCMDLPLSIPYTSIVGGDGKSASVAAASIVAKVTRDRIMTELDKIYPQYEFVKNKGYVTKRHKELLALYGACPEHRKTYAPVKKEAKKKNK